MAPQTLSIQSFFQVEPRASEPSQVNDIVLAPDSRPPERYALASIDDLTPGSRGVRFVGQVANVYRELHPGKLAAAAKGCISFILLDETAAISIRLCYASEPPLFGLGNVVTVWTTHVFSSAAANGIACNGLLFISIFPDRDHSCGVHVHPGHNAYSSNPKLLLPFSAALMPLKSYMTHGHESQNPHILVCVRAIAAKKGVVKKSSGNCSTVITVGVFDHTAALDLILWGMAASAPAHWMPYTTTLLISSPGYRLGSSRASISLTASTQIVIDPPLDAAAWLRDYAKLQTTPAPPNPPFPSTAFHLGAIFNAEQRILYTLAQLDAVVRVQPAVQRTGYLSVLLLELRISTLHQTRQLMAGSCEPCRLPLYANCTRLQCKSCEAWVPLRVNPRIVGRVLDETGSVPGGKLIWSNDAYEELLGRTADELCASSCDLLRYLEHRMTGLRVTLIVGWRGTDSTNEEATGQDIAEKTQTRSSKIQRLCVLDVRM